MTITLCIETSGPHCSVVLAVEEQNYVQERLLDRSHNEHLLAMLDDLFKQAGLAPTDVDLLGFGCGPGSFTGVRIAAAAVQAVAFAANAVVVPVASSRVLAMSAARAAGAARIWLCCIPSRGQTYYLSAYSQQPTGTSALEQIQIDELVESPPNWLLNGWSEATRAQGLETSVVGVLPPWLSAELSSEFIPDVQPSALAMVAYVRQQHEIGKSLPPERALPMYITGDSPWRKTSERRG